MTYAIKYKIRCVAQECVDIHDLAKESRVLSLECVFCLD